MFVQGIVVRDVHILVTSCIFKDNGTVLLVSVALPAIVECCVYLLKVLSVLVLNRAWQQRRRV